MATTAPSIPAGTWQVDTAHSAVTFTARHMMVTKVRGRFKDFSADIVIGEDPLQSTVNATVQMASIDTGDSGRDDHLRTNDFFDIENHPTMTFRSTSLEGSGDEYKLNGDLTIRGVTRPVTFDLEVGGAGKDPWGNTKSGFTATGTINRKDFGVEWNAPLETGGVLVGDKVTIEIDIEALQPS
jgi:polyisoprenoid-binding protein YceI